MRYRKVYPIFIFSGDVFFRSCFEKKSLQCKISTNVNKVGLNQKAWGKRRRILSDNSGRQPGVSYGLGPAQARVRLANATSTI